MHGYHDGHLVNELRRLLNGRSVWRGEGGVWWPRPFFIYFYYKITKAVRVYLFYLFLLEYFEKCK